MYQRILSPGTQCCRPVGGRGKEQLLQPYLPTAACATMHELHSKSSSVHWALAALRPAMLRTTPNLWYSAAAGRGRMDRHQGEPGMQGST